MRPSGQAGCSPRRRRCRRAEKEPPHYHGHRDRLREKFAAAGGDALPDYELLELVLFRAIPRRDVKPLAKALVAPFGSFAEVVSAEPARLMEVEGVSAGVASDLKVIEAAARRLARGAIRERGSLTSWSALHEYLRATMAFAPREEFRILFLDKRNYLIADEVQGRGTVDHTPVYPREVARRALELSATAIILAHNHPSGDPTPVHGRRRDDPRDRGRAGTAEDRGPRPRDPRPKRSRQPERSEADLILRPP